MGFNSIVQRRGEAAHWTTNGPLLILHLCPTKRIVSPTSYHVTNRSSKPKYWSRQQRRRRSCARLKGLALHRRPLTCVRQPTTAPRPQIELWSADTTTKLGRNVSLRSERPRQAGGISPLAGWVLVAHRVVRSCYHQFPLSLAHNRSGSPVGWYRRCRRIHFHIPGRCSLYQ